jgi:hypothetical protein
MARYTAHVDVLMPVPTDTTSWFEAGRVLQALINQPSGY